jgi:glycosyltransferase involved in cell wall biosynthesis
MNISIVMVVRNEEYFLHLSLRNALKHADDVYVLDTGSTDKTHEVLQQFKHENPGRLIWECVDFGGKYSFDKEYREKDARNYALDQAERLFEPDWIVRMDADEVFDPLLFAKLRTCSKNCVSFGTELPTQHTPFRLNRSKEDCHVWQGILLHDPHIFAWNCRNLKVRWAQPEGRHVELRGDGFSVGLSMIIDQPVHFHLHRAFGPKSIYTFLYWEKAEIDKRKALGWFDDDERKPEYRVDSVVKEINRKDINNVAAYRSAMPWRFNAEGKFIVPKLVHEAFAQRSIETNVQLDHDVVAAWKNFLEYEQ